VSWFEIDHDLIADGFEAGSCVLLVPHAFLQGQAMNFDAMDLFLCESRYASFPYHV
jgi:hypothetical protein